MAIDPYVYPGTETLKNHMGIRNADALAVVEAEVTSRSLARVTATGVPGSYDLAHLRTFHREIFSKVYPWAGEIRTIDIAKTGLFGHAPHIESYLTEQFGKLSGENHLRQLSRERFTERLAHYLGEVNAAHPFRDGNGRTQRAFFGQLARDAGYRIAWEGLDPERNVEASIASHNGDDTKLRDMLSDLIEPRQH